mgnify:CR=1 FL=1|jgi:hypothetical protein
MAIARDATAARPFPLLLSAVLLACLLVGIVGWLGAHGSNHPAQAPGPVVSAGSPLQSGKPAPDRPDVSLHAAAVVEKDPDAGRQGKAPAHATASATAAHPTATQPPAPWGSTAIPARTLRSHLSQAPPARA